ncbi:MAG TPA: FxsA family protein [Xanthobacteraceae bacterium]
MRLAIRIAICLLLLPAAEFLAFLLVAWAIGFLPALGLMLLTSLAGGVVLRYVNRGQFGQFRRVLRDQDVSPAATQAGGPIFAFAGILLLLPGFITDLLGAGLLLPPLRHWFGRVVGRMIRRKPQAPGAVTVIDLEPTEWQALSDRKPRRPRRR